MRRVPPFLVLVVLLGATSLAPAQTKPPKAAPASVASLLAKGAQALDAGRGDEALRIGDAVVAGYPKRWEGHRLVARAAFLLDRPDRAEGAYRQALELAPVAAKPALQGGLREVGALRQALHNVASARALEASKDDKAAARAWESAYDILPSRVAYGLSAAGRFEGAGLFEESRRLLQELQERDLSLPVMRTVRERLAAVTARLAAIRAQAAEEAARKDAEERRAAEERRIEAGRRASEAERKRVEAERKVEEERQREEKARLDREETDRLNRLLSDQRRYLGDLENAVRTVDSTVDDAERTYKDLDGKADDAKSRRDRAKRGRDDWEDKVRDSKREIDRDINRVGLRAAEAKYNDAKDDYDRADRRRDDAKSRLDGARRDAAAARQRLEEARGAIRDTEAAILRIASGG